MYPIYFAPIQGYTEDAFRRLHHELFGGVTAYYTPFIRLEHGEVRSKDKRDVRPEFNQEVNIVPQVLASGGKEFDTLLQFLLPLGYKHIDLNMGCPFPLQSRHGRGAGLLTHPDKVEEICQVIRQHGDIDFSIKMRLGMEDVNDWKQILPILEDTPLKYIVLHPRTAIQQYKGTLHRDAFQDFLAQSHHPIIYNGDITEVKQIQELEATYADRLAGVMIGRGLLCRPSLAAEYATETSLPDQLLISRIKVFHDRLLAHYENIIPGEAQRLNKIRTFWDYLEPLLGRKAWKKIEKAGNLKNYLSAVRAL